MLTKDDIVNDLTQLGLRQEDIVFFHSSLSSLGSIEGGAETVIDAFLKVIGPKGTLCVPTIIHTLGLPRDVFNVQKSPSEAGIITEALRKRSSAIRSNHPTHSVACIGKRAKELVNGHVDSHGSFYGRHVGATGPWTPWGKSAFGKGSPWDLLYKWNAKYLLLGVTFKECIIFLYVQTKYIASHQSLYASPIPFPLFDHEKMGEIIKSKCGLKKGRVGNAETYIVDTKLLVETAFSVLQKDPLSVFPKDPKHPFLAWIKNTKDRPVNLKGGLGKAPLTIPGWRCTDDGTGLYARVLVLENHHTKIAIVSMTLGALHREDNLFVRKCIEEAIRIPSSNILVACTHVHSGPDLSYSPKISLSGISEIIGEAAAKAACKAREQMSPVRLAVARRKLEGISRIRRVRMNDGRTYSIRRLVPSTWNCKEKPEFVEIDGVLDTDLTVLRIENIDRTPVGALFHFACHSIPDFFGYAADYLEKIFRYPFVCIPLNGAEGDIDVPFNIEIDGKFAEDQLPTLGKILGAAVMELLARGATQDGGSVDVFSKHITIPVDSWVKSNKRKDRIYRIREIAREGVFQTEVMALRIGDELALVSLPGEIASEIGLTIKQGSPFTYTCPVGLANDKVGYVISTESRARGGHEADPRFDETFCEPQAEKIIRLAAAECLTKLE